MSQNRLSLYLHMVWATWDRLPMIDEQTERLIYREIAREALRMRCIVLAIGGTRDHVHVVLTLPTIVTIADLAKQLKGTSSHLVNEVMRHEMPFKWQGSYGAFTVGNTEIDGIIMYVRNQKRHHAEASILPEWEETCEPVTRSSGS